MPIANLVPLGLGELLDRTFSYFRKHFWLFGGIMVLPEGLLVGLNIFVQVYMSTIPLPSQNPHSPQAAAQSAAFAMRAGLASLLILIPYYIAYAMALGATTYALSEVYLGRTVTIRESYRVVRHRVGRLLNVIFSILLRSIGILVLAVFLFAIMVGGMAPMPRSMAWVTVIVGVVAFFGFILGGILMVIFLVRYSVAVPALVLEKLSARQALKRSVALTKGYLWRLLLVAFLMTIIRTVLVMLCQAPFSVAAILITVKGARPGLWLTIPSLLVGGVAAAAVAPLLMISFAIAYYDLRVRKEGFDLQLMMSNLDETAPLGAPSGKFMNPEDRLEDSSVFGVVLLSFLTCGIYQPIWFMTRRKALNNLRSAEKLGMFRLSVALAAFMASVCIPIVGSFKWGSWVQTENALGPLHPLILLVAWVIIVVQGFKVRRILLDHMAPREEGMFSASIRFQYDDLISRMGTFFLGIFYLQYKINNLMDWLTPDEGGQGEVSLPASPVSPLPPVNS
jgi:hypothetical protein